MLRKGNTFEAGRLEQRTRAGIEELKRGVERATESVLGDETESLRMAGKELDNLNEQINQEMTRAQGQTKAEAPPEGGKADGKSPESNADGKAPGGEAKPGAQAKNSEGKDGDQPGKGGPGSEKPGGSPSPDANNPSAQPKDQPNTPGQKGNGTSPGQGKGEQNSKSGSSPRGVSPPQPGPTQNAGGSNSAGGANERGGLANFLNNSRGAANVGPIFGDDYGPWTDRLRDVEEMIDRADLRTDIARVRERAREIRSEARKEGKKPDWAVVKLQIAGPLAEIRNRVSEELARRESNKDALVPIDRDPVPNKFSELVRRYYEQLGIEK